MRLRSLARRDEAATDCLLALRSRYDYAAIQPRTTALDADVVEGFTTFQLSLSAADGSDAQQVYAIFGDDADPLSLPAAYHVRLRGLSARMRQ